MKYVEPPHPRQEPRFAGELTGEHIRFLFRDCVDFGEREVLIGGDPEKRTRVFFIQGQVRGERLNDYVLRPLATSLALRTASPKSAARLMEEGTVYCQGVKRCRSLDQAVFAMVDGWAVFEFPGDGEMLAYFVGTEEKRAVSRPENEPSLKGAKDAFVESLRTNTSLVRRRLRAPELKITESVVGRQSVTPVDILYIEGLTDPELVKEVQRRVARIDTDQAFQPSTLWTRWTRRFRWWPIRSGRTGFARGWSRGAWGSSWTGCRWGICCRGPSGSSFGRDRTGPRTGWRRRRCRCCDTFVCSAPCFCRPGMWRR